MEWSTQIHFGFHSEQVEMEFTVIKSWRSFKDYFEDAKHVTAVTYCDSPDLPGHVLGRSHGRLARPDHVEARLGRFSRSVGRLATSTSVVP